MARSDVRRLFDGFDVSADRLNTLAGVPQQPELYIPGLEATPWWSRERFPWLDDLERSCADIQAEMRDLTSVTPHPSDLADRGAWNTAYFYYVGEPRETTLNSCPMTARAMYQVPGLRECGMAYFSVMEPGTHIEAHSGFTNAHLRCHLALEVPTDCRIRVGDEVRGWSEGKAFVFDDTFEHEVWNDGERRRVVLLLDTWHPDLSEIERAALSALVSTWRRIMYRQTLIT